MTTRPETQVCLSADTALWEGFLFFLVNPKDRARSNFIAGATLGFGRVKNPDIGDSAPGRLAPDRVSEETCQPQLSDRSARRCLLNLAL